MEVKKETKGLKINRDEGDSFENLKAFENMCHCVYCMREICHFANYFLANPYIIHLINYIPTS